MVQRAGQLTRGSRSFPRPLAQSFAWEWDWQASGNCVGEPTEIFFPEDSPRRERRRLEQQAKTICWNCPIKVRCLEHALTTPEQFGVWGATTPSERGKHRAPLRKPLTAQHIGAV